MKLSDLHIKSKELEIDLNSKVKILERQNAELRRNSPNKVSLQS